MKKTFKIIAYIFVGIITLMMPFISYSNWKDQKAFIEGDKQETIATIKVDEQNVKTYNFKENDYGVEASKSTWQAGDQVTIYFLKNQPYIVSENPYIYKTTTEIIMPLIWLIIIVIVVVIQINTNRFLSRLSVEVAEEKHFK